MNSKGFTKIELLIVIAVFSVIYLIGVTNVSHAFETDNDQLEYDNTINLIEKQAEVYASNNTDIFAEKDTIYIYVKDLIEANYLVTDENGNISNPIEPSKYLNDLKIKVSKSDEGYTSSIVKI